MNQAQNTNKAELAQRHNRIMATKDMPIHNIIEFHLVRRRDWEDILGAVYARNGHWWGVRKDGRPRYIGPTYKAEKKYIPVADRIDRTEK